ncbi:MAG: sterol desaturase family protein [Syntrophobacteria bacterium]|jgi:sterol desaturase/sphingolipid hydroxylase (fatty acid hydroxylase superfamily)
MNNDVAIRLGFFFGVFALMAVWELLAQRRSLTTSKTVRWFGNLSIIVLNATAVRLLFPILPVGLALFAHQKGWGLLNNFDPPFWLAVVTGVLVLDLVIYLQHVLFHAVPVLWRLHMMHHADLDFDVTTGLRFHPIEIILSGCIKLAAVIVFGPPALAVLVFEILLNATSMFNHGNIRIPLSVDRLLRLFVVTPDMHRVHHSVIIKETNSNFGFNFPWWDRLLGTYRDQPTAGHQEMTIGLSHFRDAKRLTLPWMLALPFIGEPGKYPINRGG